MESGLENAKEILGGFKYGGMFNSDTTIEFSVGKGGPLKLKSSGTKVHSIF
jgi:hypothetical protein